MQASACRQTASPRGPSLTKAFGEFSGGALKYWGEDDGSLSLDELRQFPATVLETGSALCLFDGRRAHGVEPFQGERYSLVFFCARSAFTRARAEVLDVATTLGAHVPAGPAVRYLSPAKGYDIGRQQRGIREMWSGNEVKPSCVAWTTATLMTISCDCLDRCLSFVITPTTMSGVCAVAKALSAALLRPSSFCDTIIDAAGYRPKGKLAFSHFKRWGLAKAVTGGSWERGSLSFIVDRTWVSWGFLHLHEENMLVSRLPVPSATDVLVLFCVNRAIQGKLLVGIATNASCQREIISTLDGRPPVGAFAVAAVLSSRKCKAAFRLNGKHFGPSAPPVEQPLRGIVQLSLVDHQFVTITVPGRRPSISAEIPAEFAEAASASSRHFFVMLPSALHPDDVVRPCWIRRPT